MLESLCFLRAGPGGIAEKIARQLEASKSIVSEGAEKVGSRDVGERNVFGYSLVLAGANNSGRIFFIPHFAAKHTQNFWICVVATDPLSVFLLRALFLFL